MNRFIGPFLKKVQVEEKFTHGNLRTYSTGFVCGINFPNENSNVIAYELVVTRMGKGGKPRLEYYSYPTEIVKISTLTPKEYDLYEDRGSACGLRNNYMHAEGRLSEQSLEKNINLMSTKDFIGYITAFSRFLGVLHANHSIYDRPGHFMMRKIRNNSIMECVPSRLDPLELSAYLIGGFKIDNRSKEGYCEARFIEILSNPEEREIIMDKLHAEFISVRTGIKALMRHIKIHDAELKGTWRKYVKKKVNCTLTTFGE